jgi:hypothetical protein
MNSGHGRAVVVLLATTTLILASIFVIGYRQLTERAVG